MANVPKRHLSQKANGPGRHLELELIPRVAKVTMAKVLSGKCLKKANGKWQKSQNFESLAAFIKRAHEPL